MKNFALFYMFYAREQYKALGRALRMTLQALVMFNQPGGSNPFLMFDHGLLWRVCRDVGVLFSTAIRVLTGLVMLAFLLVGAPILAVLRALVIPLIGLVRTGILAYRLRGLSDDD